jgi:serine protease Do
MDRHVFGYLKFLGLITTVNFLFVDCAYSDNRSAAGQPSEKSKVENTDTQKGSAPNSLINLQMGLREIAKKVGPAVVFINVSKSVKVPQQYFNPFEQFFGFRDPRGDMPEEREYQQKGAGSGFIIDRKKGYILTNNHVVGEVDEIEVITNDDKKYDAKVVGTDKESDIAIIQVKDLTVTSTELKLGDSSKIQVGDFAIAMGAPYNLPQTLTFGVVSATGRGNLHITSYDDFIQTDASINPGNSGGPLVNIYGEVIGMNTAIASRTGGSVGLGFAIPSSILRSVSEKLISDGKITRAYLGVHMQPDITEDLAESFGYKENYGVLVSKVIEDSPADKAGIKDDDIIMEVNGEKIKDPSQLTLKISLSSVGSSVSIKLFRGGEIKTVTATLLARESEQTFAEGKGNRWGLSLETNNPNIQQKYGLNSSKGVVVLDVEPASIAEKAGVEPGDIILSANRVKVDSIADFKKLDTQKTLLLRIMRNNFYLLVHLRQK